MRRRALRFAVTIVLALPASLVLPVHGMNGATPAAAERIDWQSTPLRLLMVERRGCIYCAAWQREIAPGYAGSAEGRAAPLLRVDMDGPWPDGLALARRPYATPTFVLLENGLELARIEGYPGKDAFYPQVAAMLDQAKGTSAGEGQR